MAPGTATSLCDAPAEDAPGLAERKIQSLVVTWADSEDRRLIVGTLRRLREGYQFEYSGELARALESGFTPFADFPHDSQDPRPKSYFSGRLFPVFAQRIPSKKRPDFLRLMSKLGVASPYDGFAILAASGGRQMTDRIEVFEERGDESLLAIPLTFRVAGSRFYAGAKSLREGDALDLKREPDNAQDPNATLVLLKDGEKLGYVPRPYADQFAQLLDSGVRIVARTIRQLPEEDERHRWVVEARRAN